jgi:hypothetical protein
MAHAPVQSSPLVKPRPVDQNWEAMEPGGMEE